MRSPHEGWRSARRPGASPAPTTAGRAPQTATPADAPRVVGRRRLAAPTPAAAPAEGREGGLASSYDWPWKGVEWSLTYVAFLVYIFVVTTYKLRIGDVAMAGALLGVLFVRQGVRVTAPLLWMGAWVVWSAIGSLQSEYSSLVMDEVITIGKVWLIAFVAVNTLRTKATIRLYCVFFLGCYALFPTRGAIFNYLGGYTVFGRALWNYIYSNPNDLAALTLLQLSIAVSLLRVEWHKWTRYCVLLGCAVLPVLILMTQSRGAFLALAIFVALYIAGQKKRARALIAVGALAAIVVMAAPGGVWKRVSGLAHFGTQTSELKQVDEEGSAFQRYEIWRVARAIIADHPAFGVGFGAYPEAHRAYVAGGGFNRVARGGRDTHSTYLNVAAETGFIGLTLFMAAMIAVLASAERARRRWRAVIPDGAQQLYALELGMIAYLIAGLFGSFAKLSFLYLHVALLVAVAHWLEEAGREALARQGLGTPRRGGLPRAATPLSGAVSAPLPSPSGAR